MPCFAVRDRGGVRPRSPLTWLATHDRRPHTDGVVEELTVPDQEILERKERIREADRRAVAAGEASWAEMNRANTFTASVAHLYRPVTAKRGKPR